MHPKRSVPAWYDLAFVSFLNLLFLGAASTFIYLVLLAWGCMDTVSRTPVPYEIHEAFSLSLCAIHLILISIRIDSGNMPGRAPMSRDQDIALLIILVALAAVAVFMGCIMDTC